MRVDVAVVNGTLKGYEIKSLADTLRRLPAQVQIYSQVLDYATIVLAESHRDDACALLPSWWEIMIAVDDADGSRLETLREGAMNPCVDTRALAELLWHSEAIDLLRSKNEHRGLARKPRVHAWDRIAAVCSTEEVRATVRARLKERAMRQPERSQ